VRFNSIHCFYFAVIRLSKQSVNVHKCKKGNQRPITALNMAPMELDCDVDGAIYRQNM